MRRKAAALYPVVAGRSPTHLLQKLCHTKAPEKFACVARNSVLITRSPEVRHRGRQSASLPVDDSPIIAERNARPMALKRFLLPPLDPEGHRKALKKLLKKHQRRGLVT